MSDWIARTFCIPRIVLPGGAALLAVPVIIHLINRLRFRRVRFAAMEFLLKSQQRNRRRLLIEQLLLALADGWPSSRRSCCLISRLVLDPERAVGVSRRQVAPRRAAGRQRIDARPLG